MAIRTAEHISAISAWPSFAGVFATLAIAIVFLIRTATTGMRKLIPEQTKRSSILFGSSVWIVLSTTVLAGFATVLSSVTHHRGLGGTTFAFIGICALIVSAFIAARLTTLTDNLAKQRAVAWASFGCAFALIGAMVLVSVRGSGPVDASGPALAVADAAFITVLCIGASRIRLPNSRKRIWVPTTVLILLGIVGWGISSLNNLAESQETREKVVLLSPVLDIIAEPDAKPKRFRFWSNKGHSTEQTP